MFNIFKVHCDAHFIDQVFFVISTSSWRRWVWEFSYCRENLLHYTSIYTSTSYHKICLFKILIGQIQLKCTFSFKQSKISTLQMFQGKFKQLFSCFLDVLYLRQKKKKDTYDMPPFASFLHTIHVVLKWLKLKPINRLK